MLQSKLKAMILVFFYIRGIVMKECLPPNQMVNQQFCIQVLTELQERIQDHTSGLPVFS
jgi:hypothetical protein